MSGMTDMTSTSSGSMDMKMYFHGSIGSDMLWFQSWMPTSAGATAGVCIGVFLLAIFERYLVAFRKACDAGWRQGQTGFIRPISSGILDSPARYSTLSQTTSDERRSSTQKPIVNPYESDKSSSRDGGDDIVTLPQSPYTPESDQTSTGPSTAPLYTSTSSGPSINEKSNSNSQTTYSHLPAAVQRNTAPERPGRWSRPFKLSVDLPRGLMQSLQTLVHYLLMLVVMTFQIWWILAVVVGAGVGEMMFGRFGAGGGGH